MNRFKVFQAAVLISILSILTGCSDEIISPNTFSQNQKQGIKPEAQENIPTEVFHSTLVLKPGQSTTFSYANTGFYRFNSISVQNCEEIMNDIEVTGYLDDEALLLSCYTKGFWVSSLTIKNISGHKTKIDLYLTGSKVRVPEPGPGTKKVE